MIQHKIETITPEIAVALLANNTRNRQLRRHIVDRYARDMAAGQWTLNGEAIIIAQDETIVNGQHRLTACIRANTPFKTLMVRGVDGECFGTVDQGLARSFSDALHLNGEVCTVMLSAALVWMWRWEQGALESSSWITKPTNRELQELLEKYPQIRESVSYINPIKGLVRDCAPSGTAFCHFHFFRQDPDACERFFNDFAHGASLSPGDPVLALRERLIRSAREGRRPDRLELVALICKAWQLRRAGKRISILSWRKGEKFPDIWQKKQRPEWEE
jgi:hypothetical protein